MMVAFAVGIRPCTGAILVLVFALSQNLFWAGIASTFAMALGTAIAVSSLAALTLGSKKLALHYAQGDLVWFDRVSSGLAILGALLVFVIGVLFFTASLGPARPF